MRTRLIRHARWSLLALMALLVAALLRGDAELF